MVSKTKRAPKAQTHSTPDVADRPIAPSVNISNVRIDQGGDPTDLALIDAVRQGFAVLQQIGRAAKYGIHVGSLDSMPYGLSVMKHSKITDLEA